MDTKIRSSILTFESSFSILSNWISTTSGSGVKIQTNSIHRALLQSLA